MARCPSCEHEVSALHWSLTYPAFFRNFFRSPANRIFTCRNCGAQLTMTTFSFVVLQVAFVLIVIPCAIVFARLQTWLLSSSAYFHQFSTNFPIGCVVLFWIVPTLVMTLLSLNAAARFFVTFEKAE